MVFRSMKSDCRYLLIKENLEKEFNIKIQTKQQPDLSLDPWKKLEIMKQFWEQNKRLPKSGESI